MDKNKTGKKLVTVTWDDAGSASGWERSAKDSTPVEVQTSGYLVEKVKAGVRLAMSISESGNHSNVFFIPRGMIKSIKGLK